MWARLQDLECEPLPSSRHVDQYSLHRRIWCALCRLPTFGGTFSALSVSNHRRAYRLAHVKIQQPWLFSKKPAKEAQIKAGLKRAVAQGVKLGRPKIDSATERKVRKQLAKGVGILKVAKSLGIGTGTVQRISKERAMSPRGAEQ